MEETAKKKLFGYEKALKKKRTELANKLVGLSPATQEFADVSNAIAKIDDILNRKAESRMNVVKGAGLVLLTILGLGLAHKDDIGDSIPGKYVSKFVDTVMFRKL